jgi:hypothetical protein
VLNVSSDVKSERYEGLELLNHCELPDWAFVRKGERMTEAKNASTCEDGVELFNAPWRAPKQTVIRLSPPTIMTPPLATKSQSIIVIITHRM